MRTINWKDMSDLGLVRRINEEILHPIGLAVSYEPETGISSEILIADDGEWEYADKKPPKYSIDELKIKIQQY